MGRAQRNPSLGGGEMGFGYCLYPSYNYYRLVVIPEIQMMEIKQMREQLENRLKTLKSEFGLGHNKLAELETQVTNLRNTLLRISGAIQVLEEVLENEWSKTDNASSAPPAAEP